MNATQTQNKDLQLSINKVTGTLNLNWQADTSIRSNLTLTLFELNLPIVLYKLCTERVCYHDLLSQKEI